MKVVSWAMAIAPVAVFSLLSSITTLIGFDAIFSMTAYVLTVVAGLASLLIVYLLIVGQQPGALLGSSCRTFGPSSY